jgi:hypothetical protein
MRFLHTRSLNPLTSDYVDGGHLGAGLSKVEVVVRQPERQAIQRH